MNTQVEGTEVKDQAADAEVIQDETLLDLDNIGSMNMSDIPNAPGFVDPPDGVYILGCEKAAIEIYKTREQPDVKKKRFAHYYTIQSIVELANPSEQEPNIGDKFGERFLLNPDGVKYWKAKAKAILGDIGEITIAEALAELSSGKYFFKARVQTKESQGKKESDKGKTYRNVQVRVMERVDAPDADGTLEDTTAQL